MGPWVQQRPKSLIRSHLEMLWRQVMRVIGAPLPYYKSPTLLLGFGLSPFVLWRLWKLRPDVIHVAFPGAQLLHWLRAFCSDEQSVAVASS